MKIGFLNRIFSKKTGQRVAETTQTVPADLKSAAESLAKKGNHFKDGFVHSQEYAEREVGKCADQLMEQMTTRCEFDTMLTSKHDEQLYESVRDFFASEYPYASDEVVTKFAKQIIERKHHFHEGVQKAMKRIKEENPQAKKIKFEVCYDKENPEKNKVYALLNGPYEFIRFNSVKEFSAYGHNEIASFRHVHQDATFLLEPYNY